MLTFLSNNRGGLSRSQLFWIIVLSTAGYFGYHFIPMLVKYKMLTTEIVAEAKIAHHYLDEEIVDRIMEKADSWNVPVNKKDIKVHRRGGIIYIKVTYEIEKVFLDKKKRTFYYIIDESMELKRKGSVF